MFVRFIELKSFYKTEFDPAFIFSELMWHIRESANVYSKLIQRFGKVVHIAPHIWKQYFCSKTFYTNTRTKVGGGCGQKMYSKYVRDCLWIYFSSELGRAFLGTFLNS